MKRINRRAKIIGVACLASVECVHSVPFAQRLSNYGVICCFTKFLGRNNFMLELSIGLRSLASVYISTWREPLAALFIYGQEMLHATLYIKHCAST